MGKISPQVSKRLRTSRRRLQAVKKRVRSTVETAEVAEDSAAEFSEAARNLQIKIAHLEVEAEQLAAKAAPDC